MELATQKPKLNILNLINFSVVSGVFMAFCLLHVPDANAHYHNYHKYHDYHKYHKYDDYYRHHNQSDSNGDIHPWDVQKRKFRDWEGNWQSVYRLAQSGKLDVVFDKKAKEQNKSIDEIKQYYLTGYATNIERISIDGNRITFDNGKNTERCRYKTDGFKILTYESGKHGVRYLFHCNHPYSNAPRVIQFSDHQIKPTRVSHFHLYMGNGSHEDLFSEVSNWPTYYPASFSDEEIIDDMLNH
ncbi:ZinT/AdcA family metal-binding protein [Thorsellia anophelis]|uniref:Zn/Cd-binding protein ZinT n=1 Tax=Thorsellia anophelis DSM 18579 TaxID=1123402 RepID=A0A1I0EJV3_9GAMM|nr:ZinT/AdcA family metal-binding protein [Thorsellia anophelis]SET45636.1 Zn/Cd-binding protein ZinT [Thorsellia anophelis DSM 18579]